MITIKMYGADWCPDCQRAKAFLKENNIDFTFVDVDADPMAATLVEEINNGKRIIPTFDIEGTILTNPDNGTLAHQLGINEEGRVILFGADWCPDCQRAKSFLYENEINYQFIDVDEHAWATDLVENINNGKRIIPTLIINNETLTNPDNGILREVLQIEEEKEKTIFDSIIIGAGAAGLTTSLYAQRDGYNTLILEKRNIGGNAYLTEKIENYPGFESISGPALMKKMAEQVQNVGGKIKQGVEVRGVFKENDLFRIETSTGEFYGRTVVIATGSSYRKLNIPNEAELIGSGVHFCATCDGAFYKNKEVIVIGGGNSALEEGLHLAEFTKKVRFINISPAFTATQTYIDQKEQFSNIEEYHNRSSLGFELDEQGKFAGVKVKHNETGEEEIIKADGAFLFVGLKPNTGFLKQSLELDERNYIKTDAYHQTNIPGVFAAGDNRAGAIAQVAFAVGEGVAASYGIRKYLKTNKVKETAIAVGTA